MLSMPVKPLLSLVVDDTDSISRENQPSLANYIALKASLLNSSSSSSNNDSNINSSSGINSSCGRNTGISGDSSSGSDYREGH